MGRILWGTGKHPARAFASLNCTLSVPGWRDRWFTDYGSSRWTKRRACCGDLSLRAILCFWYAADDDDDGSRLKRGHYLGPIHNLSSPVLSVNAPDVSVFLYLFPSLTDTYIVRCPLYVGARKIRAIFNQLIHILTTEVEEGRRETGELCII